jgi:hypothetical protein
MVTEACQQLSTVITDHHDLDHDIGQLEDDYDSDPEEIASSLTWEHEVRDRMYLYDYFLFF